jgi:hypothetical protein
MAVRDPSWTLSCALPKEGTRLLTRFFWQRALCLKGHHQTSDLLEKITKGFFGVIGEMTFSHMRFSAFMTMFWKCGNGSP